MQQIGMETQHHERYETPHEAPSMGKWGDALDTTGQDTLKDTNGKTLVVGNPRSKAVSLEAWASDEGVDWEDTVEW